MGLGCPVLQLLLTKLANLLRKHKKTCVFQMHENQSKYAQLDTRVLPIELRTTYATSNRLPMFLVLHSAEAQCSASVVWWWRNGSTKISTNQRIVLPTHSRPGPCQNVSLKVCFSNTNLYSLVLRSQQTPFWDWSGK